MRSAAYIGGILFLGGCASTPVSRQSLCGNELGNLTRDVAELQESYFPAPSPSRAPASTSPESLELEQRWQLSVEERDRLETWTELRIKRVQSAIDQFEHQGLPSIAAELHAAANHLVAFHGYLSREKRLPARHAIAEVNRHAERASMLACGSAAP